MAREQQRDRKDWHEGTQLIGGRGVLEYGSLLLASVTYSGLMCSISHSHGPSPTIFLNVL